MEYFCDSTYLRPDCRLTVGGVLQLRCRDDNGDGDGDGDGVSAIGVLIDKPR